MTATILSQKLVGVSPNKGDDDAAAEGRPGAEHIPRAVTSVDPVYFRYDAPIEAEIAQLCAAIGNVPALARLYNPRWLSIQLLEGDESLIASVRTGENDDGQSGHPVQRTTRSSTSCRRVENGCSLSTAMM